MPGCGDTERVGGTGHPGGWWVGNGWVQEWDPAPGVMGTRGGQRQGAAEDGSCGVGRIAAMRSCQPQPFQRGRRGLGARKQEGREGEKPEQEGCWKMEKPKAGGERGEDDGEKEEDPKSKPRSSGKELPHEAGGDAAQWGTATASRARPGQQEAAMGAQLCTPTAQHGAGTAWMQQGMLQAVGLKQAVPPQRPPPPPHRRTADVQVVLGDDAAHGAGGRADVGAAVALVEEGEDEDAVGAQLQRSVAALLLP